MDKNKVRNQLIKNLKNLEKTVMDLEDLYTEDNNSEFLHEMQDIIETNYYNIFPMSIDEWKIEIRGWIDELGKMNFPEPDDFKEHIGEKVTINKTQYTFDIENDGIDSWCSWNSDNHKVAVMLNLDEYIGITFDLRSQLPLPN